MTSRGGKRPDDRGEKASQPDNRNGGAFGPRGAELLGELRRIGHDFGRDTVHERAVKPEARKHTAHPDQPPKIKRAAAPGWPTLNDVTAERAGGSFAANPLPNAKSSPSAGFDKSNPSAGHDNVYVAHRSTPRARESVAPEAIANIREPRIVELRPSPKGTRGKNQGSSPGDARNHDHRPETPGSPLPAGEAAPKRAIEACLKHLGSVFRYFFGRAAAGAGGPDLAGRLRHGFQNELRTGLRVLVLGVGLSGGWAIAVPLSAAVMVAGTLVVESNVKKIQHPTGGVVAEILAHDGMRVKEGELLVRLDEVQARSNLQVIVKQLDETRVRVARLIAERDGTDAPKLTKGLSPADNQDNQQLVMSELALFTARASARKSQKELLGSHISQLGEEIAGLDAQIKSKATQLDLISSEQRGIQTLYDKQLVPLTRLTALQRETARLDGEREQLVSAIAETRSKISEAELQVIRIDQDFRAEVTKDLREAQDKETELAERKIAAQDLLNRIELRAPTAGVVHELAVHTIGGVIKAGDVIMEIVPDTDDLEIEARLPPKNIDQVHVGQKTFVRLSAFNQRTTPQVSGVVSYVSADLTHDRQNDAPYYTVKISLPSEERHRLGNLQLVSGMPAEVFLQTGSRTMMSYLLKPIADQLQRTFSEP
jgi:HlyD family secretion protein